MNRDASPGTDTTAEVPTAHHFETLAIRAQMPTTAEREHSVPLFLTSSFRFDSAEHARALFADETAGNVYSRYANPNTDEFIHKLCLMEGAEDGIATATGMSAVLLRSHRASRPATIWLQSRALFGSTHQLLTRVLPKWGITFTYVDGNDPTVWQSAIQSNTKLLYVESPSTLGSTCSISACWDSFRRPAEFRSSSTTALLLRICRGRWRWARRSSCIPQQNSSMARVACSVAQLLVTQRPWQRHDSLRDTPDPQCRHSTRGFLSKSLETLALRMDRHCSNALALAQHFEGHSALESVRYPFLPSHPQYALARKQMSQGGAIVVLVVKGGIERGRRFLDAIKMCSHTPNLGDSRSIVTHPASTTHAKLTAQERASVGIVDGLVRVSVGLEHVDDIVADLEQALAVG